MKLLKKSVLSQEINNQRKIQIDEGVYIATKIDNLRKSLNELEEQYQNFATNKQIELDNQFKSLERELKEKRNEIHSLEERRVELLRPLNDEWFALNQDKEDFKEKEKEFSKRFIELNQAEKKLEIKKKDLELQMKSLGTRIKANETETKKIKDNLRTSEKMLELALERERKVDTTIQSKQSQMLAREANIASRERELDILMNNIQLKEKEIIKKTVLLEDREATLEREIKRRQNK